MARSLVTISAELNGPFFSGGTRDKEMRRASRQWVKEMTDEGTAKAKSNLTPGHGVDTGDYKGQLHPRILNDFHGGIGNDGTRQSAILGNYLETGDVKSGGRFKGYSTWKKTKRHIGKITRQLGGKIYARMVKRLT